MNDLFAAARALQDFCDQRAWRSCFIGGIAVQRWGEPRVTRDVDLDLLTGFGSEDLFINTLLAGYAARIPDAAEFARRNRVLLLQTPEGIGIDVSLAALSFEENVVARSSIHSFGTGLDVRTCSAEDLIVLKLFASRAIDIRDAESVAVRNKGRLDWKYIQEQLRPLAELKDASDVLDQVSRLQDL